MALMVPSLAEEHDLFNPPSASFVKQVPSPARWMERSVALKGCWRKKEVPRTCIGELFKPYIHVHLFELYGVKRFKFQRCPEATGLT